MLATNVRVIVQAKTTALTFARIIRPYKSTLQTTYGDPPVISPHMSISHNGGQG